MDVPGELVQGVVETMPTEVAILDAEGTIVYTNPAWREFGVENGLVGDPGTIGVNYLAVCEAARGDDVADGAARELEALLAGEKSSFSLEYPCHSPAERRWFAMDATAYEYDGARYVHVNHLDVTDRKTAELRLQGQNDRLATVAGVLSHDLRSPLNVATGYLDLLAEEVGDSEAVDRIESALLRMESIISDALVLARQTELGDLEEVDLREQAEASWRNVATDTGTLAVPETTRFEADASVLSNLFENLFRNALTHAGPDVAVRVGPLEGRAGFYVEDDGPGIPPERRDQVFEVEFSTGEAGEHTGLGLTIVREVAAAHGWDVTLAESAEGGARFEFSGVTIAE